MAAATRSRARRARSPSGLPPASWRPTTSTPRPFRDALDTAGIPDPDLVIRTSGEMRLSNFLLWQAAYSEFVFMPCYWPDFTRSHLAEALEQYAARERRFGGLLASGAAS